MISRLFGKVALVTGAGSGLGRAIAIGLADQGAEVILIGRREQALRETQEIIQALGGNAFWYAVDVSIQEAIASMASQVLEHHGIPVVLVNAAGIYGEVNPISQSDPAIWMNTLMTNTAGPYLICRAFAGEMMKTGWGRIVNITSAASLAAPTPSNSAYAVSKVALNHFTRQLAAELQGTGVTANVMHPGEVMTEMFDSIRMASRESGGMANWINWVEQTGGDLPEKTVKLILDLLKPESDPINGRFLWIEDGLKKPLPSWE
ncbi:SDR family NAD(P)-dependent oxidoreductase [Paenibacillus agricola]|uniref:SDR family oxidoreductase n=1 Tax=Paenibacillus agricola TaxID=2716264 RepID=A0ABX0JFV1_9BACL|nr:SDR family oxidoreductase [Paenibacillus agricola]NHN34144.1 SDR family oxidoreductase [Paenibacillus agricola]